MDGIWLWIILALIVIAVAGVVFMLLRRPAGDPSEGATPQHVQEHRQAEAATGGVPAAAAPATDQPPAAAAGHQPFDQDADWQQPAPTAEPVAEPATEPKAATEPVDQHDEGLPAHADSDGTWGSAPVAEQQPAEPAPQPSGETAWAGDEMAEPAPQPSGETTWAGDEMAEPGATAAGPDAPAADPNAPEAEQESWVDATSDQTGTEPATTTWSQAPGTVSAEDASSLQDQGIEHRPDAAPAESPGATTVTGDQFVTQTSSEGEDVAPAEQVEPTTTTTDREFTQPAGADDNSEQTRSYGVDDAVIVEDPAGSGEPAAEDPTSTYPSPEPAADDPTSTYPSPEPAVDDPTTGPFDHQEPTDSFEQPGEVEPSASTEGSWATAGAEPSDTTPSTPSDSMVSRWESTEGDAAASTYDTPSEPEQAPLWTAPEGTHDSGESRWSDAPDEETGAPVDAPDGAFPTGSSTETVTPGPGTQEPYTPEPEAGSSTTEPFAPAADAPATDPFAQPSEAPTTGSGAGDAVVTPQDETVRDEPGFAAGATAAPAYGSAEPLTRTDHVAEPTPAPVEPYGPGSAEPDAEGNGPQGWTVKGNGGSMLFHTTDSPSYDHARADVWFADEETARAAGFAHWDRRRR